MLLFSDSREQRLPVWGPQYCQEQEEIVQSGVTTGGDEKKNDHIDKGSLPGN